MTQPTIAKGSNDLPDCPHAKTVGILQAKVVRMEKEIEKLKTAAQAGAVDALVEKATKRGYWRGVDTASRVIGYVVVAGILASVGHVTGALELLLKFFKL